MVELGTLEWVDLRVVWRKEALDFTPWLAAPTNLALLSETIGLDLEVVDQEAYVDEFRFDLMCRDRPTGHDVLIENQLGRSDHSHLGQVLTYAAGRKPITIIWIAALFTEGHRAALDWLNQITDDSVRLFALEIELWKIGSSAPAPKFNIVSKPNDWVKAGREVRRAGPADTALAEEYWGEFLQRGQEIGELVPPVEVDGRPYPHFALPRADAYLAAWFAPRQLDMLTVGLNLLGPDRRAVFRRLASEREVIDAELKARFPHKLAWQERPRGKESVVTFEVVVDVTDRDDWARQHEWLLGGLVTCQQVFAPRLESLTAD